MKAIFVIWAVLLLTFRASSQTVTTYSTLAHTGNLFNPSAGWLINGSANPPQPYIGDAFAFTPTVSGYLSDVNIAIGAGNSDLADDLANISITANGSGNLPGGQVESFLDVAAPGQFGANQALTTLNSAAHPYLQAGSVYWLAVEPSLSISDLLVNISSSGQLAPEAQDLSPGAWGPNGNKQTFAFSIEVTPVPEPSVVALTALGILFGTKSRGLLRLRKP